MIGAAVLVVAVIAAVITVGVIALGGSDDPADPAAAAGGATPVNSTESGAPTGAPVDLLQSMLNPETMADCQPAADIDSQWADAQVTCTGPQGVPVDAYHFASQSSVDRQIGALAAYIVPDGDCDEGHQSIEDWSTPQEPTGGVKLCYFYADNFVIYWFYEADRLAFSVEHSDPAQLITWWRNFNPVKR